MKVELSWYAIYGVIPPSFSVTDISALLQGFKTEGSLAPWSLICLQQKQRTKKLRWATDKEIEVKAKTYKAAVLTVSAFWACCTWRARLWVACRFAHRRRIWWDIGDGIVVINKFCIIYLLCHCFWQLWQTSEHGCKKITTVTVRLCVHNTDRTQINTQKIGNWD